MPFHEAAERGLLRAREATALRLGGGLDVAARELETSGKRPHAAARVIAAACAVDPDAALRLGVVGAHKTLTSRASRTSRGVRAEDEDDAVFLEAVAACASTCAREGWAFPMPSLGVDAAADDARGLEPLLEVSFAAEPRGLMSVLIRRVPALVSERGRGDKPNYVCCCWRRAVRGERGQLTTRQLTTRF